MTGRQEERGDNNTSVNGDEPPYPPRGNDKPLYPPLIDFPSSREDSNDDAAQVHFFPVPRGERRPVSRRGQQRTVGGGARAWVTTPVGRCH